MLLALVPEEIVATRESLKVVAARVGAIEAYLCRPLFYVLPLVPLQVFWVKKALLAYVALMRPLRAIEVGLTMTTSNGQMTQYSDYNTTRLTLIHRHDRISSHSPRSCKDSHQDEGLVACLPSATLCGRQACIYPRYAPVLSQA